MSILSAQCDELRSMAESVGLEGPQTATLMMGAADAIDRLDAENAKLRGLVCHMYECMGNIDADGNHECDSCEYDNEEGKCDYERRMRELGIEVDE